MCGRFVTIIPYEELKAIYDLVESNLRIQPRFNVAPTQQVGVIRCCDEGNRNRLDFLKWGLIPSWSKDAKIAGHTINARSETVAEKPAFRHAIKYKRCIVPVNGFYEWSHTGATKRPYFIHPADNVPMSLAGIWEQWKGPDGDMETFSILTTSANKLVSQLHDRMPVILSPDKHALWLNRNMHDAHALVDLYSPYPAELMALHEVSTVVNNPRFDSPDCLTKV